MKSRSIVACSLAFALSIQPVLAWHVMAPAAAPVAKALGAGGGAAGGAGAGAAIVGGGIAVLAVIIIAHELKKKRCDLHHDTWVDTRHDMIPVRKPWRDPCAYKRYDPAKIIPFSK